MRKEIVRTERAPMPASFPAEDVKRLGPIALLLLLALGAGAVASEIGLTGGEGHPRSRFPLDVFAAPLGDVALAAAVRKAVGDWNAVFQE
ncbi:MAG: hypothetical protein HY728_10565, partial [Candidatus Rokubacteria bacterium]|nr:hypothetical protein [Candidatus Rokubacteria bacterium]